MIITSRYFRENRIGVLLLFIFLFCHFESSNSFFFNSFTSRKGRTDTAASHEQEFKLSLFDKILNMKRSESSSSEKLQFLCIDLRAYNYNVDVAGVDIGIDAAGGKRHLYPLLETISDAMLKGYRFAVSPNTNRTVGCFTKVQQQQQHGSVEIPLILHQSWKTRSSLPTSPTMKQRHASSSSNVNSNTKKSSLLSPTRDGHSPDTYASVRQKSPDFLYLLWTDDDILAFIKHYTPQYLSFFNSFDLHIKKMDFSRYIILHIFGGVYVDVDVTFQQSILPLISKSAATDKLEFVSYNPYHNYSNNNNNNNNNNKLGNFAFVGNAFFAVIPRSHILKIMINRIISYGKNPNFSSSSMSKIDVLKHTGPIGLADAVKEFVASKATNSQRQDRKKLLNFTITQTYVRILNHQFIGNEQDKPQFVTHYRQHKWGRDAEKLTKN